MKAKIAKYIKKWESQGYPNGIPDQADAKLESLCKVPSYRAICKAILRNDVTLSSLGFTRQPSKVYSVLKGIEIAARKK